MKKLLQYVNHSDAIISLNLNPLRWWRFHCAFSTKSDMDPGLIFDFVFALGPFRIVIFIDDGSW